MLSGFCSLRRGSWSGGSGRTSHKECHNPQPTLAAKPALAMRLNAGAETSAPGPTPDFILVGFV